jgi:hypothetical protein
MMTALAAAIKTLVDREAGAGDGGSATDFAFSLALPGVAQPITDNHWDQRRSGIVAQVYQTICLLGRPA